MKNFLLRASSFAAAAALSGLVACGSSSGCGQTTSNPTSSTTAGQGVSMTCGSGTVQITTSNGPQCVSAAAANGGTSTSNTSTH